MNDPVIYKYFNDDELLRISNKVKEKEKYTSGEICVSIKEKLPAKQKKNTIKQTAEEEFFRLGVNNTRDKTGILILVVLDIRSFYILADEGINIKVSENTWNKIKDDMQHSFLRGSFCKGITDAVEEIGNILAEHFPVKPDDTNELSNRVNIN